MDQINPFVLLSITLGGGIFLGLVLFWFVAVYLKKRVAPKVSIAAAATTPQRRWEEKRTHPRLSVSWHALIPTAQGTGSAQLRDISRGGAFVVCPQPLPLSARFEIVIEIPERPPLALQAEVVWSNANVPGDAIVNRGMGVRFVDNDAARRQALGDALSTLMEDARPPAG
jgi:Tfp pilus assembly protein PilZ